MNDNNYSNSMLNKAEKSVQAQNIPVSLHPIVQPAYVNQMPAPYTPIFPVPSVPQPTQYVTPLDPVFVDHLSRHENEQIIVTTTAGKIEGVLTGVAVDHIQLNLSDDKAVHIRVSQIVFFEGFPISYR